ncbi:transglutaminase domain-containing protein [Butyrivibrio sp. X503]|uniref:transglutaminase domain-containing protein n=1 Tax=Butyrivibrio sp. X503 TaxID=2364878 RepID=UPI000EA896A4|nr:transglutaminase-like domain-containing protein [Butyrivibrio sp. X503]RKM55895.1 transglutaminase domain-containing protein [Butyrivibrio sp. X503]
MKHKHLCSYQNRILPLILITTGTVIISLTACVSFHKSTVPEGYGNLGTEQGSRSSSPVCLVPTCPGTDTKENEFAHVDYSNSSEGYIAIRYLGSSPKVKLQVTGPDEVTYTYNLSNDVPKDEIFPLQSGDGNYIVNVFENITSNRYSLVFSTELSVTLKNEFTPFLYPNQFVDFTKDSLGVKEAETLAYPCDNDLEVISQIYNYVIENISYDHDKASNVESGYLPDIDQVFTDKKGICLDYASLMTAMLRSQNIPTKMEVGYAGTVYHAWLSAYVDDIGWINGMIEFDGVDWSLMDPTFASTTKKSKLRSFLNDEDTNYSVKYIY